MRLLVLLSIFTVSAPAFSQSRESDFFEELKQSFSSAERLVLPLAEQKWEGECISKSVYRGISTTYRLSSNYWLETFIEREFGNRLVYLSFGSSYSSTDSGYIDVKADGELGREAESDWSHHSGGEGPGSYNPTKTFVNISLRKGVLHDNPAFFLEIKRDTFERDRFGDDSTSEQLFADVQYCYFDEQVR